MRRREFFRFLASVPGAAGVALAGLAAFPRRVASFGWGEGRHEDAVFKSAMPKSWDGGAITFTAIWIQGI